MKKNIYFTILIVGIFSLALIVSFCDKGDEQAGIDAANQLIAVFNTSPLGVQMNVEPGNILVKSAANNRFHITFKKPAMTFDTSIYKNFVFGENIKEKKIPFHAEEMSYIYGPKEKYLEVASMKGMAFKMDWAEIMKKSETTGKTPLPFQMNLEMSLGNLTFKNYNISAILDPNTNDFMEMVALIIKDNPFVEWGLEKMKYDLMFPVKEEKMITVSLTSEKIEGSYAIGEGIFIGLYKKDAPSPDFKKILEQGKTVFDIKAMCKGFNVSVKENVKELGSGFIGKTNVSYFTKPDDSKSAFVYGFTWGLEDLELSIPDRKDIELAGNIKEMKMNFSIENINPAFAQTFFDLTKESIKISAAADQQRAKEQQMMMGMKFSTALINSKPVIKLSLSPFKHYFGELSAESSFQFNLLGVPPVGKAVVNISNIEGIIKKLKGEKTFSPDTVDAIIKIIDKIIVSDESGNGSLTFELKPDHPRKYFLNDKAGDL
jgi:hypothetical protein